MAESNSGASARGNQWQLALLWLTELREGADMADIITFNSVLAAFDGSGQHLGKSVFLLVMACGIDGELWCKGFVTGS